MIFSVKLAVFHEKLALTRISVQSVIFREFQRISFSFFEDIRYLPKRFSKRQRITLRLLYAIGRPSVVCLSVCRLRRWCTLLRRLNFSAIFFHHTIAQGL